MQPTSKLTAYIGFSVKARRVVYGYDRVTTAKGVKLAIAAEDINRTAKKQLQEYCTQNNIPLQWVDGQLVELCVHRRCKCIGLTDENLARAAQQELIRMRREESNE